MLGEGKAEGSKYFVVGQNHLQVAEFDLLAGMTGLSNVLAEAVLHPSALFGRKPLDILREVWDHEERDDPDNNRRTAL